ncbi:uncharacterized protein MEPE_04864 [Melanopsichium pennsylvanicum]|uniref:Uncharacterized protein n=2 Tax=Melanopsichium pennsylvanicum TaxID=63383 RepID=A0AAJ4XPK1_9BASI|nr:putative protein [Melanopsichium pennsylvanicum 4]SNX86155.1 uncharacterized protein MEPE_04864 [Melanopsichium pennsylvanicum]
MSKDVPLPSSSSPRSISNHTTTSSSQPSPPSFVPSTHIQHSTLVTSFESTSAQLQPRLADDHHHSKLGLSLSAPHLPISASSSFNSTHPLPMLNHASSASTHSANHPSASPQPIPVPIDNTLRGADHGVSPIINALRSPYPPSPSYFVTIVPPHDYPISPNVSQYERDRFQRGSLLPLYPTLGGQLWAISREFSLPSLGGLMLYLADDGQGNRGPRIGDAAWQALWSRYFADDDATSTSYKLPLAFPSSRRSSIVPADSFADPSASSSAHVADLSRSTQAEASSSRPSIPYVSSRPSPRFEALAFSRRDASDDWSPSARSAAWSAHASSSAARLPIPPPPFPTLPILARIEWQVDYNKASWWHPWIAARTAPSHTKRPLHKPRRSMHLANNAFENRELNARPEQAEYENQIAHLPAASHLERHTKHLEAQHVEAVEPASTLTRALSPIEAAPSDAELFSIPSPTSSAVSSPPAIRAQSPAHVCQSDSDALAIPLPPSVAGDDGTESIRSVPSSTSMQSLRESQDAVHAPLEANKPPTEASHINESSLQEPPTVPEQMEEAPVAVPASACVSPSDEPLRSARASIVSMDSDGHLHTSSASRASTKAIPTEPNIAPSTSSLTTPSRSASPQPRLESGAALLNYHASPDHSRTGYSELLEVGDADEKETEHDASFTRKPLPLAHDGDYSALPDSPVSETHEMPNGAAAAAYEHQDFPHQGFALRHSFIMDAGDEAMWRDLQHPGIDDMFPEPRDETQVPPSNNNQQRGSKQSLAELHAEVQANGFELVNRSEHHDAVYHQQHTTKPLCTLSRERQQSEELPHLQNFAYENGFEREGYYSPQRSNIARIQSWIGKTPTGPPNPSHGFEHDFSRDAEQEELALPKESDIDEVVGLWASKIGEDPYRLPHINGPITFVNGNEDDNASVRAGPSNVQAEQPQDRESEPREAESTLNAAPAPAFSLLSPIHLDAAAFGGVKPQLGNLTVPLSPQLLSPTAVGDAFNTSRAPSSVQRSVSTPTVQHHPPSSPSSLAPPEDRSRSSASRRNSGDLSDTLEEMQKALELLSPGCSPNPGHGPSPDPAFRKMSSRDSLAYARSLSASVTPSPKWIARAKAATAKSSRSTKRGTFAAAGSPFDRGQVSPRPASTSAVSSSRAPVFRAPFSASRLMEFSQADQTPMMPRLAKTEGGDADSNRSRESDETNAELHGRPSKELLDQNFSPPGDSAELNVVEGSRAESFNAATPKVHERKLEEVGDTTAPAVLEKEAVVEPDAPEKPAEGVQRTRSAEPTKMAAPAVVRTEEKTLPIPPASDSGVEAVDSQELLPFLGDDHEDGIASIQRFLRGKVVSAADSDASLSSHNVFSASAAQESSPNGTIIELSSSPDSDIHFATSSSSPNVVADLPHTSEAALELIRIGAEQSQLAAGHNDEERRSQHSHTTNSHHPSGAYSSNSNSPKRGETQHEVRTPSFTYDAHLTSEPTTVDTQLSSGASVDERGSSAAGQVIKTYLGMSSSPSDETSFRGAQEQRQGQDSITSSPSKHYAQLHPQQQKDESTTGQHQHGTDDLIEPCVPSVEPRMASTTESASQVGTSPAIPMLAYRYASSPVHSDHFSPVLPAVPTHDYSLDEDEIRTMNEDTRAAVREALSASTAHHVNIAPGTSASSGPLSPKSSTSPTSPLSSHSSVLTGDPFMRHRASSSSLNYTGSGSNVSSPNLTGTTIVAGTGLNKRRPAHLNLEIDDSAKSPPSNAAMRRLPSTSPRGRFGQLPPSPSLHPSYKMGASSPLSRSFPIMAGTAVMGSPQGKGIGSAGGYLPSLASVTSIEGEF